MLADYESSWLEDKTGEPIPLNNAFSIGRSPENTLVLKSEGVSRAHALIQYRGEGQYFLIDLSSRNGTWVNERRILEPVLLRDNDEIVIDGQRLVFHQTARVAEAPQNLPTVHVKRLRAAPFWLLIADIEDFTALSCELSGSALADLLSDWLAVCRGIVEAAEGRINKYLGDGFFAVWDDTDGSGTRVKAAVEDLLHVQAPAFRMALHRGTVHVGGSPILSEESFFGREVNFVFRIEKVAASAGIRLLLSEAAATRIAPEMEVVEIAPAAVKGFEETHRFFVPKN